ncbi:uncharacterized protein [Zea mays]|uniref:Uncharacterized protein n=1 Tax=Zea mays TaxID=4577 RepID=A0A1D6MS51_MAIZE|nr:uncharacterized protein LOC103650122 isoform X1 [Zea mays]XP_008673997.1 uncharacterized protein LOC103650122 isoform X1 [Zea mays]XP_008673998.1 uncharacterized protein LOC103650122 isoform X1 [Zea mays]ONM31783.1 hypothetical protein ZEAMMB73_Zm00001d040678 [Zea mays]ONM31791.1 hypothetical protein ZEAMMB73_Zm00001d040678 [Zea mays]ONM31792.1 hypothetical protein ZEAMMB73_Zm00001d040678 [Zea mays]|eukprot:XP_008673996.1 uncharacterized protein LOC103650122 isoform X1 [Zea mays]
MAPASVPALPTAMDTKDEGDGGSKNQNSVVVVKSEVVCTNGGPLVVGTELVKYEGGDTTECSSSFGDTCSGFEGEADNGEPEVNSSLSAHANGVGPSKPPRRKKVMAEWSNSVRPIQWRCHWLELRMRELSSQISKYDKELALIKKQNELQQAASKANGTMSESMQIHKGHGNSIMKRRKRKRHEDSVDASLYINKHQILSYYHDKQNKGVQTGDLLVDDDCGTVDGSISGGLDTTTLLDSEDYDMICEQHALQDILLTIDGLQSRVHLLQDRLSKAHSEGENLAFSGADTDVRVAGKRQRTQKHSFSNTKSRHTKPQKRKNLNILLKDDDDGQALAGGPALADGETDVHMIGASRSTEERSGECNHSRDKAITVDLLLGTGNSITNSDIGDLYNVNTDDVLIANQAAVEACQQFHEAKHLPSGSPSKDKIISAPAEMKNNSPPVEVKNTCGPVKIESLCSPVEGENTSDPALEQESFLEKSPSRQPVSPGNKQELKPKKRRKKKGSLFTKKQRKVDSRTPDAKEKTEGTPSDVAEETESPLSGATGPGTMRSCCAGKKRKSGNEPADANKTGKPSSAVKKQKTENPTAAANATKKRATEKKLESASASQKLQVEKAVLVAVNSRRSQRVRKPKVFAD